MRSTTPPPDPANNSGSGTATPEFTTESSSSDQPTPPTTPTPDSDQPSEPDGDTPENPNREAAKYRLRLRETEAELKTAQEALQAAQDRADALARALVTDHAERAGIKLDLLAAAGHEPGSFFTEAGEFDPGKLAAAIRSTADKFGLRRAGTVPTMGTAQGKVAAVSWADILADAKRTTSTPPRR